MSLADHMSPEATIAYALMVPAVAAVLGLAIAGGCDAVSRIAARRAAARERAKKWKGVIS